MSIHLYYIHTSQEAFTKKIKNCLDQLHRTDTIRAIVNHKSTSSDFRKPGHMFPLIAVDGGLLVRPGDTEAAVDLQKLCGASHVAVICEVINEDGTMSGLNDLKKFSTIHNLKMITIKNLIIFLKENPILS